MVDERDDLTLEWITLLNRLGRSEEAMALLTRRNFHPWEGGEGKLAGAQENPIHFALGCAWEALCHTDQATTFFEKASMGLDYPASAMYYNDQPPDTIYYQGLL